MQTKHKTYLYGQHIQFMHHKMAALFKIFDNKTDESQKWHLSSLSHFLKRGYNFSFSFLQIQFPKSRSKKSDPDWHQRFISNILKRFKALEMEASICILIFLTFIFKFCTYMNLWFGILVVFSIFFLNLFSPFFRIGKTRIICQVNVHECDETHTKEMGGRHILQID